MPGWHGYAYALELRTELLCDCQCESGFPLSSLCGSTGMTQAFCRGGSPWLNTDFWKHLLGIQR